MKIFALLTVLLFLALQAQTEPFEERADQVPGQDQPGDEPSTRNATGERPLGMLSGSAGSMCHKLARTSLEKEDIGLRGSSRPFEHHK
ncbi:hypothetical protein HPG69_009517, partial [Diceros bicornis minor]